MSNQNSKGTLLGALGPALRLPAARMKACDALPYFAGGVNDLVPHAVEGFGKIGVTRGGVLVYDPELLSQWTAAEAGTVLIHEYNHIFARHADRFDELLRRGVAQETEEDRDDWNQAADAEINDNLRDAGLPLPSINGCPPVFASNWGSPDHQSAEQYFAAIKEQKQKQPPGKGKKPGAHGQSPGCGSGAGNPMPNEPDVSKIERDNVSQDITRRSTAEKIIERGNQRGDVPAGWLAQAEGEIPSSDIPWEDELRQEVFSSVAHVEGLGDYTFTVPSRYQSALNDEYGDDAPVLPGEHAPLPKVVCAIDTSGSETDESLLEGVGHVMGILDTLGGMTVTFIACDAAVQAVTEVRSASEMVANLKGRGGTYLVPVFEHVATMQEQPEVLVFKTDGYDGGGLRDMDPPPYKVIWLVSKGGMVPAEWGKAIFTDPEERRAHAAK